MDVTKTFQFSDGRTLEIIQDEDPQSPREWDNLGTMACFHKRSDLGDKDHGIDHTEFGGFDEMEKWIRSENPDCVILPIYLYEHGGVTINTTGFSCEWDSMQLGFIFVSREKIKAEFGEHGGRTDEQIETYLRGEVETYDQYLRGDIYGFILREPPCPTCEGPGKAGDSCWGFYGSDPVENGMGDHLETKYKDELEVLV